MKGTVFQLKSVTIKLRQHKLTPAKQNTPTEKIGECAGTGLIVWASALHAEGRGFKSRAGTFPDFCCRGICCAGVGLCCLCLIVTLWLGKLFLSYYQDTYIIF